MLYQKPATKTGFAGGSEPVARLSGTLACDVAFRVIARRCLSELAKNRQGACGGDPDAVHEMRIALTRLRTAILFFSPMVNDLKRAAIRRELKWLNSQLGVIRDLDVAIERLQADKEQEPKAASYELKLRSKRKEEHRHLARSLRSDRYLRLMKSTSEWIEDGQWTKGSGKAGIRSSRIVEYSANKLSRWQRKLLRKSRKLLKMSMEKRHRLRLLNKKLTYSIEALEDLFPDEHFVHYPAHLKYLRRAQKCLGQLNDDARGHTLSKALDASGIGASAPFISPKREARLLRNAATAYRKLAELDD